MPDPTPTRARANSETRKRKSPLAQTDVPSYSIEEALRVARAIADQYGKAPATPLEVAKALEQAPNSGPFRTLAGAALAYGFTDGGAFAERIGLTELGIRAVAPTHEGDDLAARQEALLRPRVCREFLARYRGSKWPRQDIGQNVLEQMGVPKVQTERALVLIHENAASLGYLTTINGVEYVQGPTASPVRGAPPPPTQTEEVEASAPTMSPTAEHDAPRSASPRAVPPNRRVFITHGRNKTIVDQLKQLLLFGDFEPIVAVEESSMAKALPDKVLESMRACTAAIVHIGSGSTVVDQSGEERQWINPNVLIEIGAAMALYGHRFILLVERGVALPSNLQGLYEVRYTGQGLDHESTMALLGAFHDFKGEIRS